MAVIEHLADRGWAQKDQNGTRSGQAWYMVTDLAVSAGNRLPTATHITGIPNPGEAFTPVPDAVVTRTRATPVAAKGENTKALVEVNWSTDPSGVAGAALSTSDPIEYAYRTITVTDETIRDIDGTQMSVTWTNFSTTSITQTATAELEKPAVVVDITRTISVDPIDMNRAYGGKVNDSPWGPYAADTIRCEGFTATASSRTQGLWRVTGTFFPSPAVRGDWLFEVTIRNGWFVPDGVVVGDGIAIYSVYERVNLNSSGFVLP